MATLLDGRCQCLFDSPSAYIDAGAATDPGTVQYAYRDPAGTVTTYTYDIDAELVKDSTGVYHVDIDADLEGTWYYRFYSTGSGQATSTVGSFVVFASDFP